MLVLIGVRSGNFAASAARIARLDERKRSKINAEMVFRSRANPGFRINGAAQVIVQVRAFRHFLEQVAQLERICARRVQVKRAAALSLGLTTSGTLRFRLCSRPRREE